MKIYKLAVDVLSPLHLSSAQADVVVDAEAVHDAYGMPYFPAKRFKGLLYESAVEMAEISAERWFCKSDIDKLFGNALDDVTEIRIENLYLENYEQKCKDWKYLKERYGNIFGKDDVWELYTKLRYSTSIDPESGTALKTSLHNIRVVDKGITFFGCIELLEANDLNEKIVKYALKNLRYAGVKRNRGLGEIECRILEESEV